MCPADPPEYGRTGPALRLFIVLLSMVVLACMLSCGHVVHLVRLPPPLMGDLACSDPLAQCMSESGVCRERRRGECR